MPFTTQPLDASTRDAFAELVERNNGISGGCWCIGFHPEREQKGISHRAVKEDQVRTSRAGGGLVEAIPEVTTGRAAQGRFLVQRDRRTSGSADSPASGLLASTPGS